MPKMPWLKLYTEIRTDPKMQALTDSEFRTWINILCLAAESKVRGTICIDEELPYPIEALARALLVSTEELEASLKKFQRLLMVDIDKDGIISVTHFDDRQYDKPSDKPEEVAERVRRHRAKKDGVTPEKCNADVTPMNRASNAIDKEEDKEGELELDNNNDNAREEIALAAEEPGESVTQPPVGVDKPMAIGTKAIVWAEKHWGRMIAPGEAEAIIGHADELFSRGSPEPDAVVIEALRQCLAANARNLHYLQAIMRDWREANVTTVAQVKARESERQLSQKEHKRRGQEAPAHANSRGQPSPDKYESFYL